MRGNEDTFWHIDDSAQIENTNDSPGVYVTMWVEISDEIHEYWSQRNMMISWSPNSDTSCYLKIWLINSVEWYITYLKSMGDVTYLNKWYNLYSNWYHHLFE